MDEITKLHSEAMEVAERAYSERFAQRYEDACRLFQEAFEKEHKAADLVADKLELEPTRSVLHRSAASLAIKCNDTREAEKLIARALVGNPPDEIAEELRELLELAYFNRHLLLRGVSLGDNEVQLSIAGVDVAPGITPPDLFIERVQDFERLFYRNIERIVGSPFRETGRPPKSIVENYSVFLGLPRAASYAVTLYISQPHQLDLPSFSRAQEYIDDILHSLELLNESRETALKEKIKNEDYYENFVLLSRKMAPDGERVRQVGLTVVRGGLEHSVALRRPRSEIKIAAELRKERGEEPELVEMIGELVFAHSKERRGQIKLRDESGKEHPIIVKRSQMADIVRPLYEHKVRLIGRRIEGKIHLAEIDKI